MPGVGLKWQVGSPYLFIVTQVFFDVLHHSDELRAKRVTDLVPRLHPVLVETFSTGEAIATMVTAEERRSLQYSRQDDLLTSPTGWYSCVSV